MTKCLYCGKEFEISVIGSGGHNRLFCYECLPAGLDKQTRDNLRHTLIMVKTREEKVQRGCDICGYNKSAAALEWHHPNQDKEENPSNYLKDDKIDLYYREIQKCQLICSNCHREIHDSIDYTQILQDLSKNIDHTSPTIITRQDIINKYLELHSYKKVAMFFHCNEKTVSKICQEANILNFNDHNTNNRTVLQIDKNTNQVINKFNSIKDAEQAINKIGGGTHISSVCSGKRKTACGYKWQYAD